MVGVDTVFHLVGGEWQGSGTNLLAVDVNLTRAVVDAAVRSGVDRFFTISHLGANRSSAYPVLKAKGIVEEYIRQSGLEHTILRAALVFGPGDGFTTHLAMLFHALPGVFLIPGGGSTQIQPIWIEDLVTSMVWALDDDRTRNSVLDIGGPEYLTVRDVITLVMEKTGVQRALLPVHPSLLRGVTVTLDTVFSRFPTSVFWIDYFAADRTCALDSTPRQFGLMPSRMNQRLDYLEEANWRRELWRLLRGKRKK
jgi:NADH dehydrogenase